LAKNLYNLCKEKFQIFDPKSATTNLHFSNQFFTFVGSQDGTKMKKFFVCVLLSLICGSIYGQNEVTSDTLLLGAPISKPDAQRLIVAPTTTADPRLEVSDSTISRQKARDEEDYVALPYHPYAHFGHWYARKGLSFSLDASVFASFGKHSNHSVGFGQRLSALYAVPLSDKLTLAVGGWLENIYWAHDNWRDAGVSAVLGYRFDEHWEAFVYGKKSILHTKIIPYPLYDMGLVGDRIGAAVRYNVNPSFSIQVSVEHGAVPNDYRYGFSSPYVQPMRRSANSLGNK